MAAKKWSSMSSAELLDQAQSEFNRTSGNHLAPGKTNAALLLAAAQVQSTENLTWTLERVTLALGNRP